MAMIPAAFSQKPKENLIVGRLIAGYGELEFDLAWCVRWIIDDEDSAFKVIFRAPGEMQRILMADALARLKLPAGKQRTVFEQTIAGMHHCRKIRNQYAHCHWIAQPDGRLCFVQLEEIAAKNDPVLISSATQHELSLPLLEEQEAFFHNVQLRLWYLLFQGQLRAGEIQSSPCPEAPQEAPMPKLHN